MFESIKHWFASLGDDSGLFVDVNDEVLHCALASLLYHFIALEKRHDGREKHEFDRLMKHELGLDQPQIDHLYQAAKSAKGELYDDLHTISTHLKDNPTVRMRFMQKLLGLVNLHGAHSEELKLFYETLHEIFPDVKTVGGNDDL